MISDRAAAASTLAALVFCASYAAQRLAGFVEGDPLGAMGAGAHVPLTWRLLVAGFHAGIAAVLCPLVDPARILGARRALWGVVAVCAGVAVWTR